MEIGWYKLTSEAEEAEKASEITGENGKDEYSDDEMREDGAMNAKNSDTEVVVRCKDCKWLQALNCPLAYIENHAIQFLCRPPEWYCADGERREEK